MGGRRLGQNFLLDPSILSRIVEAGEIEPENLVVEIGPGLGKMTRMLAEQAGRVVAIEVDRVLVRRLGNEFAGTGNVEIVHADCLKYDFTGLPPFKVVANIPYYITTPIIFRLLEKAPSLQSMVITVQQEVADRMVARPGTRDYGVLTVMLEAQTETVRLFSVPRGAFRPPPKVDSSVVRIRPLPGNRRPVPSSDLPAFRRLVGTAFAQRRKTMRNALRSLVPQEQLASWFERAGIDPRERPDNLGLGQYLELLRTMNGDTAPD